MTKITITDQYGSVESFYANSDRLDDAYRVLREPCFDSNYRFRLTLCCSFPLRLNRVDNALKIRGF